MVREELISSAVSLLQDPSVASSPIEKRVAFLQSKNLTREEIDVALSRVGEDPAAAAAATSTSNYQPPPQQAVYRPPPPQSPAPGYGYPPYGQWQAPPEPPKRDWRDWFIMATVVGGVGYGLYTITKRYISPLIAPPTPPQLEQDKQDIDEQFARAFTLIDQLSTDTAALKSAEEERSERLDAALKEVENLVSDMKNASRRRDDETRRISDEVKSLKDAIPKAMENAREGNENRLKELSTELKSLKVLLGNRLGGGGSGTNSPVAGRTVGGIPLPTASRAEESAPASNATTNATTGSVEQPSQSAQPSPSASTATLGNNPLSQLGRSASIPAWQMAAANRSKTASPASSNAADNSTSTTTATDLQFLIIMSSRDHPRDRTGQSSRHHTHSRSRSRSPNRTDRTDRHRSRRHHHHHHHHDADIDHERHRRDGERERHRHHRHHRDRNTPSHRTSNTAQAPIILPYQSRELTKHDLTAYTPLFAMYLDIQKGLYLEELPEDEVKGRWKSFIRKWNHGELAEGWYDPAMLERARANVDALPSPAPRAASNAQAAASARRNQSDTHPRHDRDITAQEEQDDDDDDNEDDDYGPTLPQPDKSLSGPTIPTIQDLELKREQAREDALAARHDSNSLYRTELRSHRAELRHMHDEVAPRAEPGTHERRMEKRQEAAQANRAFAEARRGGSPGAAVPDEDLMGSGENDLDAIKKSREREQRKKNEREIRREEIMRAKAAEREERLQKYREKEEETIGWLKTLAKQRFG
ncbi:uncharacterized protein BP01DRAFT_417306 [Aspergillus saccharolyticus JOP 1030-1]|uniref:Peroxisomal membrane protein PEX14 n=1 Tax=Aspergillus saccharolyticus JOP 1030-1 TaxID=1450539 RepID=A0A318ZA58_9EURO|nr:hypothetical protein BP01DRAFT_417306 [Aspergillus saccharolyticus JOP 1030-1]PYH43327.1 hypothetical protein BP01DRAFT_417306 [Aspergillus saccharolyticus JOP 1030-1]